MRALWAVLLVACSSPSPIAPSADAGTPPVVEDDAAVPEVDAGGPLECTEALSSIPTGTACDGGFLYVSYGGRCPRGEVGTCTVLKVDSIENQAEACCAKLACVQETYSGSPGRCAEDFDGGKWTRWRCPDGKTPAGTCKPVAAGANTFCCED